MKESNKDPSLVIDRTGWIRQLKRGILGWRKEKQTERRDEKEETKTVWKRRGKRREEKRERRGKRKERATLGSIFDYF